MPKNLNAAQHEEESSPSGQKDGDEADQEEEDQENDDDKVLIDLNDLDENERKMLIQYLHQVYEKNPD